QPSIDDLVYDADVELCNPMLTTGCYDIPVTAALYPGKMRPGDSVRIQVDAIGPGGPVIADAALFTFADQQSLRLDIVLYANCLGNVECAKRDQACGPLDTCIDLQTGHAGNGPLDLALPKGPEDMSVVTPPDLTNVDLAGADLTLIPPDLVSTVDLAGCTGVMCPAGQQCVAGVCQACGGYMQTCCFGPVAPPPNQPNAGSTGGTGTCTQMNLACNGSICVNCGATGQLCCPAVPQCQADVCIANTCQPMPMFDMSFPDMAMPITGGPDLF
ncbi:MAG TPA: hypothetical protein VF997_22835, partial [Polyangia bacterium]